MTKRIKFSSRFLLSAITAGVLALSLTACTTVETQDIGIAQTQQVQAQQVYRPMTQELVDLVKADPAFKRQLEQSIALAAAVNPDPQTNPAQTLEAYFDYVNWAETAMPWAILLGVEKNHPKLYNQIDQSLNYFYFVNDRPLDELKDKGLYIPSLQYAEPNRSWLIRFTSQYGKFLSTPKSWNEDYLNVVRTDKRFGLDSGDYEDPSNWKSFNDFFVRKLASPDKRPISAPDDDSVVVSPADAVPQGIWRISKENELVATDGAKVGQPEFVPVKSRRFSSVSELLGPSRYKDAFAGGTMTQLFLDVYDYHRYHFPISGTVREVLYIPGDVAVGGYVNWDKATKSYVLHSEQPGWQMIEARAVVVVETEEYGLVAVMPIGMSQISSIELIEELKPGAVVRKGDELGSFLFGGSTVLMLFQKDVKLDLSFEKTNGHYPHQLMGQAYGRLFKISK